MNIKTKHNISDEIFYLGEDAKIVGRIVPLKGKIKGIVVSVNDVNKVDIHYIVEICVDRNGLCTTIQIFEDYTAKKIEDLLAQIPKNSDKNIRYSTKYKINVLEYENEFDDEDLPF